MRGRFGFSLWCLGLCLGSPGCGSPGRHHGDSVAAASAPLRVPAGVPVLDFDVDADPSSIALTFDDGPDEDGNTAAVADILRAERVHATFFVNTRNAVDVLTSSSARTLLQRLVADGHEVGNHGVTHESLGDTSTDVDAELAGVVAVLGAVAPDALATRLVRAPFGEPYFGPQAALDRVAPTVARYGVHIGWNIDSLDWACESKPDPVPCIMAHVLGPVDAGRTGIVLLHSTLRGTVAALPQLIAELRRRGKRFIGVEELVVAKYGRPSRALVASDDVSLAPAQASEEGDFVGTGCAMAVTAPLTPALVLALLTLGASLRARSPRRAARR